MGLKIKAGMAVTGLVLSWCFGLNGLSGIASYVDSTGNILVDIADGIGLVSKGIEALESYLESKPAPPLAPADASGLTNPPDPGSASPDTPPTPAPTPSPVPPTPVICRKGKCTPYDPSKDRVLQAQLIRAERERILQQVKSGELPADTVLPKRFSDDDFDEDDYRIRRVKVSKRVVEKPVNKDENDLSLPVADSPAQIALGHSVSEKKRGSVDILNPHDPDIPVIPVNSAEGNSSQDSPASASVANQAKEGADDAPPGRWRVGVKRVLGSLAGMTSRLKTLLLKVVTTVFPWNRRAKRRLTGGDGEDEE